MKRRLSHFQGREPILEGLLRDLRIRKANKLIPHNAKVLDLGCGYEGFFLHQIEEKISYAEGIDINVGRSRSKKIILRASEIEKKLPYKDATYDIVTALALLEHVEYPSDLTREIHRVLKPDGKYILTTPTKRTKKLLEFLAYKLKIVSEQEIKDHQQYFDEEDLKKLLLSSGFKKRRVEINSFQLGLNLFAVAEK